MLSKQEDLLWLLLQYRNIVGYVPTICQSPTKMDVVLEVLKQCKQKAETLNLNETDLVFDHAIYAKAVEIVMNEKFLDLRTFINIQMGGLHAASIFLGVIGKRFKDAGLKDLIIESRLLGEDQVDQMLKGNQYNNDIRIHCYIAEAISGKKFETFAEWLRNSNKYNGYNGPLEGAESEAFRSSLSPKKFK